MREPPLAQHKALHRSGFEKSIFYDATLTRITTVSHAGFDEGVCDAAV